MFANRLCCVIGTLRLQYVVDVKRNSNSRNDSLRFYKLSHQVNKCIVLQLNEIW